MRWTACLTLLAAGAAAAGEPATFKNRAGTHTLAVKDGAVYHALGPGVPGSVNDETARARGGNRLTGVVAAAGAGFADLDDVHVVAVDAGGGVWHAVRLPDGTWLRWGCVGAEVGLPGKAVGVTCASTGRRLTVTVRDAAGVEATVVREPDGRWRR